jgi:GT2 family glycosyltransferase
LLFIDNASTDATPKILTKYRDDIRILQEGKRGPAAARNCGLRAAKHEIIAFTDADCVVEKDWLRHLVIPLQDPTVGISGGKILAKRPCSPVEAFSERLDDHESALKHRVFYAITMSWASRLAVLQEVGLFDESFRRGEDSDLSYRIFLAGYRAAYTPAAVVYHRNPTTCWSLFIEGGQHGLASVKLSKKHAITRKQLGYRRIYPRTYLALLRQLVALFVGRDRCFALCFLAFNGGKKLGKLLGSIQLAYLEL